MLPIAHRQILDCNRDASISTSERGPGWWAMVLVDHPGLRLSLYEPRLSAGAMIRYFERALADRVTVLTHLGELDGAGYNFVTSFSVLEHVWDRRSYLRTAFEALRNDGIFYLNYDDGHFRKKLHLGSPRNWGIELLEYTQNLLAPLLPKLGLIRFYQASVRHEVVTRFVEDTGFRIIEERYENLESFKQFIKSIEPRKRQAFVRFWIRTEDRLNRRFSNRPERGYANCGSLGSVTLSSAGRA
jgi:hypothetical protein